MSDEQNDTPAEGPKRRNSRRKITVAAPRGELSAENIVEILDTYVAGNEVIESHEQAIEAEKARQSDLVRALVEDLGAEPFVYKGVEYHPVAYGERYTLLTKSTQGLRTLG